MKTYSFILSLVALLGLGACSTTYQTGQAPDAVYYSPAEEQQGQGNLATTATDDYYVANNDSEGDRYVIYKDDDDYNDYMEGYNDGYYSRRINMFDRPGGLFSYNYYMMNRPLYGSPYLWNSFAYNSFGWYNDPFMWSPGLRLGLSWGMPLAYGGWYNRWYNPFYSYNSYYPYYGGYGYGYFPGYYGGGKYLNTNPRPAVSYGPRRSAGSPAAHTTSRTSASGSKTATAPRRVFRTNSNESVQGSGNTRVRRSFKPEEGERTIQNNSSERRAVSRSRRRVFKSRPDETPVRINRSSNVRRTTPARQQTETRRIQQPRRVQQPTYRRSSPAPTRSYSSPSTSTRSSSSRTFSPRRH